LLVLPIVPGEDDHRAEALKPDLSEAGFRQLAEFRHRIRQFLHFSEQTARSRVAVLGWRSDEEKHQTVLSIGGEKRDPVLHPLTDRAFIV
jgi:DNA repair photolyase